MVYGNTTEKQKEKEMMGDGRIRTGRLFLLLLQSAVCSAFVLIPVFQVSCRLTEEGIQILSGDYASPELISFTVQAEDCLVLVFSERIEKSGFVVTRGQRTTGDGDLPDTSVPLPDAVPETPDTVTTTCSGDGTHITCMLSVPTLVGEKYTLFGELTDRSGNTLTICIPFTGFNGHLPGIILTEVQDGKAATGSLKYEFIELYTLESGNLSGLELYSGYDGQDAAYMFPPVEVHSGEYITVHLRKDGNGCIDELEDDLALATGYSCCDSARDLWADNEAPRLGNSGDAILLIDSNSSRIFDALLYCRQDRTDWPKESVKKAAGSAYDAGVWSGGSDVTHAVYITKKSSPYFLARTNIPVIAGGAFAGSIPASSSDDWVMIKPSQATPGRPNI